VRLGSDPTDEQIAAMTEPELEAWSEADAIGGWEPNAAAEPDRLLAVSLIVHVPEHLAAELRTEASVRGQPCQRYLNDLLLLALRQSQAGRRGRR